MLKIGIITPISNEYPFLGRDLKEGLELALHDYNDLTIIQIEAGKGAPKEVLPAFRQLLIKDEVNIIVAFIDILSLQFVSELIEQCQIPVIATGIGARLPLALSHDESYLFYNTFRMWESCWLSGNIACNTIGKKVGTISSFFDSGFPLTYAHSKGTESSGGTAVFFNITNKDIPEQEFAAAHQNIESIEADYYFISSFGKERSALLKWIAGTNIPQERIVASPAIQPIKKESVFTVSSWFKELDIPENKTFVNAIKQATKHDANEFSMLGYETGLWIAQACETRDDDFDSEKCMQKLRDAVFSGPRGTVRVSMNQATYSDHFQTINSPNDIVSRFKPVHYPLSTLEAETEINQVPNVIGWQNTYLCK